MTKVTGRELSKERTEMANERTFLSYIRTSLTLLAVGVSFIEFLQSEPFKIAGTILIIVGLTLSLLGLYRYRKINLLLKKAK